MIPPSSNPDPDRPAAQREEAIFGGALQLPRGQRDAYIAAAAGDDAQLGERVHKLLDAHDRAAGFLEPPVQPAPAADSRSTIVIKAPATEQPGDVIGRYKIRENLGEGGCGVVYVAEQSEPVRRRVALKVIKLGMDTKSVIARFEAERQALAMMDHPNIAKVLDAGTTATGRPYFVMELVRGIKITDYCDQNHLDTRQRLDLFIQVCNAIQHAHQKGIIHRDIKPSNILVTLHDGVPVPKVIDFGIAKATEGRLSELTVYTELHQFIGTPAYMSPEQAEMSALDIDTRSDIYSLGVLLYELLTGHTPFDPQELVKSGLDEMRRTIREQEPPRPSTRLSTMLDADLTAVAKRHGAEPPRLVHLIRGDLDWIVMKSLEKDRTRRFETASGLAADLQRYLNDEPVVARPPSSLYRFQKLVRRNKAAFAGAVAVIIALVLGLGLALVELRRAVADEKLEIVLRKEAEGKLALMEQIRQRDAISEKLRTAGLLLSQGDIMKAEEIMNTVPPVSANSIIYNVLGTVYAQHSDTSSAIKDFWKSIDADPTNYTAYHLITPELLQHGDIDGYTRCRQAMLRQFTSTSNSATAGAIAWDCLMKAPDTNDFPAINRMISTATAGITNDASRLDVELLQGLADYRSGQFAAAVEHLKNVAVLADDSDRALLGRIVLALTEHDYNRPDQARNALARALRIAGDDFPKLKGSDWNEQQSAHYLMDQAKALIGPVQVTNDDSK